MGQQRVPADARVIHPAGRVAGRHLRGAPGVRDRGGRLRGGLAAVRAGAFDRVSDRVSCAAGSRRRVAHPELAGGDRRDLSGARARPGDRHLDGVGHDRRSARAARRRPDPERRVLAVDLRDQPAPGRRVPLADPEGRSSHGGSENAAPRRCGGGAAVRAGSRRHRVRPDRAAAPGLVEPGRERLPDRRRPPVRCLPCLRITRARPDAPARPVQEPELRGRERRDARALRRPVRIVLLPRAVPAAGGGATRRSNPGSRCCPRAWSCSRCPRGSARSPTAPARACSWALAR